MDYGDWGRMGLLDIGRGEVPSGTSEPSRQGELSKIFYLISTVKKTKCGTIVLEGIMI